MYQAHPFAKLNSLFKTKPYQGAFPGNAKFLFVGLDANFDPDIESSPVFHDVCRYLEDGVSFWEERGVHHPFLLPGYRGDGLKYHRTFSKIGLTSSVADQVSFLELVDVPTVGCNKLDINDLLLNPSHLERLDTWIKSDSREQVFVAPQALKLLRRVPYFRWIPNKPIDGFETMPVYYKSERLTVLSPYHFSYRWGGEEVMRKQRVAIGNLIMGGR
jgi:hypothetical protein